MIYTGNNTTLKVGDALLFRGLGGQEVAQYEYLDVFDILPNGQVTLTAPNSRSATEIRFADLLAMINDGIFWHVCGECHQRLGHRPDCTKKGY